MATTPTPSVVTSFEILRDTMTMVAGKPFRRLMVYKINASLPIPDEGVTLFAIAEGFVISSITTAAATQFANDAEYYIYDI